MATTFVSITVDPGGFDQSAANLNSGATTTSTDIAELRMGSSTANIDRHQALMALEIFKRWIMQGGLKQAGASLPQPTGSG